jgi:hypothetical protein
VTPRLVSQRGLFTLHPKPDVPYTKDDVHQIVIGKECKADFRRKLDAGGTHHAAIYADLDGLSRRLVALQFYRSVPATATMVPTVAGVERAKVSASKKVLAKSAPQPLKVNPRDPQKGQWGGRRARDGWRVRAKVIEKEKDWFRVTLTVFPDPRVAKKLKGTVTFFLHDSFAEPVRRVAVARNKAELKVWTYGAFTVGVLIDEDGTMLELDLARVPYAPKAFRDR